MRKNPSRCSREFPSSPPVPRRAHTFVCERSCTRRSSVRCRAPAIPTPCRLHSALPVAQYAHGKCHRSDVVPCGGLDIHVIACHSLVGEELLAAVIILIGQRRP